jgi:hypothetical protein
MYSILIETETLDPAHDLQAMDRYVTRPQAVMAGELIPHHSQSIPDGTEKRCVSYQSKHMFDCIDTLFVEMSTGSYLSAPSKKTYMSVKFASRQR